MNNALKAALLSGLILPGLGQINLKYYKRGAVFIIAVFVNMSLILMKAIQQGLAILEKIDSEDIVINMSTIANAAAQISTLASSLIFNIGFLLLMLCWIIATVDAYTIGKKKDIQGCHWKDG